MKKFTFVVVAAALAASCSFAADGATIFKKCITCHGEKADKSYLGKTKPLTSIAKEDRLATLKGYKAGTQNSYNMGAMMKPNVANLSDEDLAAVNDYIETLK